MNWLEEYYVMDRDNLDRLRQMSKDDLVHRLFVADQIIENTKER